MGLLNLLVVSACVQSATPPPAAWRDPSPHRIQSVAVDQGVQLEILDWGGSGQPVVLLAGSGLTAHVYDELAPKMAAYFHVVGITRRGFGASTRAATGYTDERLADDVVAALRAMKIGKVVLVGHSAAGNEITTIASRHADAVAGVAYLDAIFDPKDLPIDDPNMRELYDRLPAWMTANQQPAPEESKTFDGYRAFQKRTMGFAFPESELRQMFATNADGTRGHYLGSPDASRQMGEGQIKRDYTRIPVPILAIFAGEPPRQAPTDAEKAALDRYNTAKAVFVDRWKRDLRRAAGSVRIVDLPTASHFVFLSNESDVLRELRAFVGALQRGVPPAKPIEPISAIIGALGSHDIVGTDLGHSGSEREHALLIALIRSTVSRYGNRPGRGGAWRPLSGRHGIVTYAASWLPTHS